MAIHFSCHGSGRERRALVTAANTMLSNETPVDSTCDTGCTLVYAAKITAISDFCFRMLHRRAASNPVKPD